MGSVSSMGSIILAHVTEWWLLVVGPLTIVVICCRLSLANSLVQGWLHEGFVKHGCICTFRTLDVFLSPIPLFHQIEAFCIFIFWNSIRIYTFIGFMYISSQLSFMKKASLNLYYIESQWSRDLSGNQVSNWWGHHLFWCCKLPCFEYHCELNFFHILIYVLMIVSLKESCWSKGFNFLYWLPDLFLEGF